MLKGENSNRKAWLVGGGIASLSAAVFMVRDGRMNGKNITIFEELDILGGSMDGSGDPEKGYMIRGGRMFEYEQYQGLLNLLSEIPSVSNPGITVKEEILQFNEKVTTHSRARLVDRDAKIVDAAKMGFDEKDRIAMIKLIASPEKPLKKKTIEDVMPAHFFETNFWYMWCTTFAFEPWHSAMEFRRYFKIFIQEFERINTLSGVKRSLLNQYDSIILPLKIWLVDHGVNFEMGSVVYDLEFTGMQKGDEQYVSRIFYRQKGEDKIINTDSEDIVMVTNGCMTEAADIGTMDEPAKLLDRKNGWILWETLAKDRPEFGNPASFDSDIEKTYWQSFTVTCKGDAFLRRMEQFSGNKAGTGALVTFKDSSWLMSIVIAHQPHFIGQPDDVTIFWGYGLFPGRVGDYVKKPMKDCNGREILTELLGQLHMQDMLQEMLADSICLPCIMPYITSQFMPRLYEDRPKVRPEGYHNLAFASQFAELPKGVVFTVEYSVKCAMTAVYDFLGLDKDNIPPYFNGEMDMHVMYDAIKALHR